MDNKTTANQQIAIYENLENKRLNQQSCANLKLYIYSLVVYIYFSSKNPGNQQTKPSRIINPDRNMKEPNM